MEHKFLYGNLWTDFRGLMKPETVESYLIFDGATKGFHIGVPKSEPTFAGPGGDLSQVDDVTLEIFRGESGKFKSYDKMSDVISNSGCQNTHIGIKYGKLEEAFKVINNITSGEQCYND